MSRTKTPSNFSPEDVRKFLEKADHNDSLYEHWVEGAQGYVTTNINTELGIANGSACRYHSVTVHDDLQKREYDIQYNRGKDSDNSWVITLSRPPKAINVQSPTLTKEIDKEIARAVVDDDEKLNNIFVLNQKI